MAFDLTGALLDEDGSWPAYGLPLSTPLWAVIGGAQRAEVDHVGNRSTLNTAGCGHVPYVFTQASTNAR